MGKTKSKKVIKDEYMSQDGTGLSRESAIALAEEQGYKHIALLGLRRNGDGTLDLCVAFHCDAMPEDVVGLYTILRRIGKEHSSADSSGTTTVVN